MPQPWIDRKRKTGRIRSPGFTIAVEYPESVVRLVTGKVWKLNINNLTFFVLEVYIILFLVGTRIFNSVMLWLFAVLFGLTVCVLIKKPLPLRGYIGSMGAFLLLAFLSTLWAGNKELAMQTNMIVLRCSALGLCICVSCDSRERVTKLLACFALAVLVLDIYCLKTIGVSNMMKLGEDEVRLGMDVVYGLNANFIGTVNVLGGLLVLYLSSQYKKPFLLLFFFFFVGFVALSASRTAFILLVFGFALYALMMIRDRKHRLRAFLVIAIGAIAFLVTKQFGLFNLAFDRFRDAEDSVTHFFSGYTQSDNSDIRLRLAYEGLKLFIQRPIFGYGSGQFAYLTRGMFRLPWEPHNTYIQTMVSYGIFGLVFWQGMYVRILWRLRKRKSDKLAMILAVLIIGWLMHDMFGHALTEKNSYFFIAIGFAFLRILEREDKSIAGNAPNDCAGAYLEK